MRKHASLDNDEELDNAAWEASRGAVVGAAKWGVFSAVAGVVAWQFSPVYRGLTFQFKVFLQMSGMVAGSVLEADRRLRIHGAQMRAYKRTMRDAEVWRRYEEDFNILKAPSASSSAEDEAGGGKGS